MANHLNKRGLSDNESIVSIISSDKFEKYPVETQKDILNKIQNNNFKDGGLMGKNFGNNKDISSMYVAFAICILLAIIGFMINTEQIWSTIIPIISTAIGYIFGRSRGKDDE